jgi:hypothetical protein
VPADSEGRSDQRWVALLFDGAKKGIEVEV